MFARPIHLIALSLLLAAIPCSAQQNALTMDDVLTRVRAHVAEFRTSIPSFISDESVLSQRFDGDKLKDQMKVESSFEMVRDSSGSGLRETRIKNLVNGRAPKNQKVTPPFTFRGGFADVISFTENKCADYRFAEAPSDGKPIVVLGSSKPSSSDRPAACTTQQALDLKAFIDPETFQVLRLEKTVQDIATGLVGHVPFVPMPSSHNVLTLSVEYTPIELGGKTFWLTKTVTADMKDKNKPIRLHYEAHYTNYHRFTATSTILPAEPGDERNLE
jgi:hypothetical protein